MAERPHEGPAAPRLPHLVVPGSGSDLAYHGRAGGAPRKIRSIANRADHARRLANELSAAQEEAQRKQAETEEDVRADGLVLTVEGWSDEPDYELALKSLDTYGASLLSVLPASAEIPERAVLWIPYAVISKFFRRIEDFAEKETPRGRPANESLVANIAELRLTVLRELWQEPEPFPDPTLAQWWEVWLARLEEDRSPGAILRIIAGRRNWRMANTMLAFPQRVVALVRANASELGALLTTSAVPAELRRARFAEDLFGLGYHFQHDMVADLASRIEPASPRSPAVCVLDTGVMAAHPLLAGSIDGAYSALDNSGPGDQAGHGTRMAGLALFGELPDALEGAGSVRLDHRLESVKIIRRDIDDSTDETLYGTVTARAAAQVESILTRRRVFSIAVTNRGEDGLDGRPTSWSASLDALAFGTDIRRSESGIELLGEPDPRASRLFVVSAGNVPSMRWSTDHLGVSDTCAAQDPAQAWNALTVGAHTELTRPPANPMFTGWTAVAPAGELSPFSRTSMTFSPVWPIKPDVVVEGGNLLTDPGRTLFDTHEAVSLLTTSSQPLALLTIANATSAATAQTARLAAVAMNRYPSLWPETVRGLIVHAAEWTPAMAVRFGGASTKTQRVQLVRRYGWGVPTEQRVLTSASSSVTLIIQDEFMPFERGTSGITMRAMRLHRLPWPYEQLRDLFGATVRLRVTLSYFVEPNPSNRGWRGRYRYASHGLRFDVKRPMERIEDFQRRLSNEAAQEGSVSSPRASAADDRWDIGARLRNAGSLHADVWSGTGAALAEAGYIGITPVGGWWKENNRRDRIDLPVRYALLVSLRTDAVATDIYTPIANQIGIPVEIAT
jgi:Subtilase family